MSDGRKIQDVIKDRIYQTQERLTQYPVGSVMYNKYWDDLQILREAQKSEKYTESRYAQGYEKGWDDGHTDGYSEGYGDGYDNGADEEI